MNDTLEIALLIYGIFFFVHVLICGVISLVSLVIAERVWKLRLKFRRIFFGAFLPGIAVFILFALTAPGYGANDRQEIIFWGCYAVFTISGLAFGLRSAKKKAQSQTHAA